MTLKVDVFKKMAGVFVVAPVGPINSETATILEKQIESLLETSPSELVLNMQEVGYISSAGVRIIYSTKKRLMGSGGDLILVDLQPAVRKVFEVINALPVFKIFSNLAELDAYLDTLQRRVGDGPG